TLCDEDIEHLADETEKIVDSALLTELTSQRLYRYKEEYPGVIETIKYSEALFLDEYDYETSLKMVREKLESIETGAFEEVKSIYNKEKNYA
ncbi:MAG: septation ring formation regulator EzrA, partial [Alkalibacterium sp.]|uniref:septation ring formation regulator EzrA n=1 Tax=Alkalibacterium sp. TaxID=1872447 RepID=UPI0039707434